MKYIQFNGKPWCTLTMKETKKYDDAVDAAYDKPDRQYYRQLAKIRCAPGEEHIQSCVDLLKTIYPEADIKIIDGGCPEYGRNQEMEIERLMDGR